VPSDRFVVFDQNHDQIGNRALGERLVMLAGPDRQRVATGLTLLAPGVPLLFQGEEYGETAPFPYFISHEDPDLVEGVRRGRREEFAAFDWAGEPPDPQAESTFESARIRPASGTPMHAWTTELLRLRRETPALRGDVRAEADADEERRILTVRRADGASGALLVANLGDQDQAVAGPHGDGWELALHSADERWGGPGFVAPVEKLPAGSLAVWIRRSG
jgi:maltooligosyltrehalose trehalohydrolase